jgi:2'-5' RNA ligase
MPISKQREKIFFMKLSGNSLPGFKVAEYLLVMQPHADLWDKIMQLKKEFAGTYQATTALWSKPHLTVANFLQYEMIEPKLLQKLQQVTKTLQPIKIELKDFGSFPAHTIYINVTSKVPIQTMVKKIRTETQKLMKLNKDNTPHFMLEPHFTIARKLLPWQYEKGWLAFSHKEFTGRFIAHNMLLLKRPLGEMKYSQLKVFDFLQQQETNQQTELFSN